MLYFKNPFKEKRDITLGVLKKSMGKDLSKNQCDTCDNCDNPSGSRKNVDISVSHCICDTIATNATLWG